MLYRRACLLVSGLSNLGMKLAASNYVSTPSVKIEAYTSRCSRAARSFIDFIQINVNSRSPGSTMSSLRAHEAQQTVSTSLFSFEVPPVRPLHLA